ncbi:putative uncharacterized protein DDB_G0291812 [Gordionus sp. m RMFG-2023]|uniref:putative uncharacterized protein DDB_G0291812 n=1 Tax=Gordionus sp. m RMFG-2023 TaxID=3053472 RepID=UPI0031FE1E2C
MLTVKLYGQPILGSPIMVYATPPVRRSNSKYGKSLISQNSFIQSSYYPTFESNTAINKYDCDRRYRSHSKTNLQSISDFRISKYMTDDAAIMDEFNGGRDNKSISSLSSFSNTNQHNVFQNGYHNGNNGNHNGNHNGNQNANLLGNQYQHQNSSYPYNNQSSSSHFANETGNNGGFNSLINSEWPANFRCAFDKGSYKQPQKQVIRYSKEFLLSCAKSPLARTITADLKRNRYILKDAYKTLPDPFYMPANQLPPSTIKDEHLISNRRMDCGDSKEDIIGGIKNKILIADNEKVPISLLGGGNGKAFKIKNENMFGSETDKAPLRNTKMKRSASEITLNSQKNNTKTPDEENVISGDRLKAMIACQNAPSDLPEMIKLPNDGFQGF